MRKTSKATIPKNIQAIWAMVFLFVVASCKEGEGNNSDSIEVDSGSTTADDASTKSLFAEFSCRENKIQIFDYSVDGGDYVKSQFATNNDKFAIISQKYYEGEGGIIIEKDYCTQLTYSGNPVGGISTQFLAFLSNNPTEEPNGIQIFTINSFLFESLRDVTASNYADTAFWRDDTTLISVYKSEDEQKTAMIKVYRFQNGVWDIRASNDTLTLADNKIE